MWAFHAKCMFADPFTPPTPAIVSETATKPTRSARFCKGAKSMPLMKNDAWTPKSRSNVVWLYRFDFGMCSAPCAFPIFSNISTSKNGPRPLLFKHFWLANVFRATTACTFWMAQLPQVLRPWGAFNILTSTSASRHSHMRFFKNSAAKIAAGMRCFWRFDFQICFVPQQGAIFDLSSH